MLKRLVKLGSLLWVAGAAGCNSGVDASSPSSAAPEERDAGKEGGHLSEASTGHDGGHPSADTGAEASPGAQCQVDADCTASAPATLPARCATGQCDASRHACTYFAKDGDGDGHSTSQCKASDGTPIVLGDDCDDTDREIFPGAWDGPMGESHSDR